MVICLNVKNIILFSLGYLILNPLLSLCRTGWSVEFVLNIFGHQKAIKLKIGYLISDI
jgi:hypothetical protein